MAAEIERKFLVDNTINPDIFQVPGVDIYQGYLAIGPDSEARVRSLNDAAYTLTAKTAGSLVRGEFEIVITDEQFMGLWPATEGRRVEKTRYSFPHGEHLVELDVFKNVLHGLVVAEVEFADEATAADFVTPLYFGHEVTDDKRYKNQQLALHGIPTEDAA